MMNKPQMHTARHFRLGGRDIFSQIAQKPTAQLSTGNQRQTVEVKEANGFDVHVISAAALKIGQRVTILFTSMSPEFEVAIPGIVHWVSEKPGEAGIVLQEALPSEYEVRIPGCQRNSIRYSCKVSGLLQWNASTCSSTSALAINYSRDGFCLQVAAAPAVETTIHFVWRHDGKEERIEGIVRWVIGQEGGFLTGCQLLQEFGYRLNGIHA